MAKLDWSNVDMWLKDLRACKGGKEWVQEKRSELLEVKTNIEKSGETYNMDSTFYALEQLMLDEKKYTWVLWFFPRILEKKEYKKFITFALEQIPTDYDKESKEIIDAIDKARLYVEDIIKNDKPLDIEKTINYILRVCYMINPSGNKNVVFANILNYGIDLLKQRKK